MFAGSFVENLAIELEDFEAYGEANWKRMAIYPALGIPEAWRANAETTRFERLGEDGVYRSSDTSRFLQVYPPEVTHGLGMADGLGRKTWTLFLRARIRDEVAGRP